MGTLDKIQSIFLHGNPGNSAPVDKALGRGKIKTNEDARLVVAAVRTQNKNLYRAGASQAQPWPKLHGYQERRHDRHNTQHTHTLPK